METLTSRAAASPQEDWIDRCAFTSRHRVLRGGSAVLIHQFEKPAPLLSRQKEISGRALRLPSRAEHVAAPLINRDFETVAKFLSPQKKTAQVTNPPITISADVAHSLSPAQKNTRQLPAALTAELHSFRQLSSPLFCPEKSRDTLPEYILFGLIVLLAAAWPILAMLGVMARH